MRRSRIIHIITRLIRGGAEANTLISIEALRRQGYDARLISGPPLGTEGSRIEEAHERGVSLTLIPELVREIHLRKDVIAFLKLWRLLVQQRPLLVHTHCSKAGILGRWAALLAGVPFIVHTPHGLMYTPGRRLGLSRWERTMLLSLERLTTCFTHRLVALTSIEAKQFEQLGLVHRSQQVAVVPSGVELACFRPVSVSNQHSEWRLPPEAPRIGTVGRLAEMKGHAVLLESIPLVLRHFPKTRFLIIGDGPLRTKLERRSHELGIADHVHFLGMRTDVAELLHGLDLFVLPSTDEAMGRVLVEAMASGVPVVATRVGGVPEVVVDGVTGRLVLPANSTALAQGILELLSQPQLARRFAQQALCRAERFSAERMVERLLDVYHEFHLPFEVSPGKASIDSGVNKFRSIRSS